jgi:hypothetical protein
MLGVSNQARDATLRSVSHAKLTSVPQSNHGPNYTEFCTVRLVLAGGKAGRPRPYHRGRGSR